MLSICAILSSHLLAVQESGSKHARNCVYLSKIETISFESVKSYVFSPGKHIGREIAAAVGEVDKKLHIFVHGPMWHIYICTERS